VSVLRVGFAGTPGFAAEALSAILAAGHSVPLALTQPDRPRGRGLALAASPVKGLALERRIPVLQPATLKSEEDRQAMLAITVDVLVVAAYGLILPPAVLAWPRHGALNIHASLLPRWRGAAPIQRALLAGDPTTGITIMQMDAGLDTGPIVASIEVPIAPRDTAGTLTAKLAQTGAAGIVTALQRLARDGTLPASPQPRAGVTYAAKIARADAALNWALPATTLDRIVRAFDPAPGAHTQWCGATLKVWAAEPLPLTQGDAAGTVTAVEQDGIAVACGSGALRLVTVQPAGGKRMAAAAFAAGHGVAPGARFDLASQP
jgi:methionyl-tRNA formyltransferase